MVGPVLEAAVVAVVHDLASPSYDEQLAAAVEHRAWWLAQWPDGAPHVLGLLAQDVQEAVHEDDPLWPTCREVSCLENGRHPLLIEPALGPDPFWVCAHTGLPVAQVGGLVTGPPVTRRL